jgi:hypothetical protein
MRGHAVEAQHGPAHGKHGRLQDVDGVDLRRIGPAQAPRDAARANLDGECLAHLWCERFRIRDTANLPAAIEDHGRGYDRPRQRPSPGFVDARCQSDLAQVEGCLERV